MDTKLTKSEAKEYLAKKLLETLKELTKAWDPIPQRPGAQGGSDYQYRPGSIQSGKPELNLSNLSQPIINTQSKLQPFHQWIDDPHPEWQNCSHAQHYGTHDVYEHAKSIDRHGNPISYDLDAPKTYTVVNNKNLRPFHFDVANNPTDPLIPSGDTQKSWIKNDHQFYKPALDIVNQHHQNKLSKFNRLNQGRFGHVADEMDIGPTPKQHITPPGANVAPPKRPIELE